MKTFFFFIALSFSSLAFSQGNLQFNQVKLVSSQETVPVGKVWKVENLMQSNVNSGVMLINPTRIFACSYNVNGKDCFIGNTTASSTNISPNSGSFPFWLPAGSTLEAGGNMHYLSVIEFNIVP